MPENIEMFHQQVFNNGKKIIMANSSDCLVSLAENG